ncbi:uncharacterized protein LOC141674318 [Apium graveolens]|uniref:uncharacterized protein LOC141674318 n=1 Tax=Apium graveolens TaxID=4045 RepID=UPI003D7B3B2E
MKPRYYPKTDLLDADLGTNLTYVWRGIFASLEVIKSGARKKIGNGENTLVWRDPWLPNTSNGYVGIHIYDQLRDVKVSSLMIDDGRNWDVEVIEDLLETRDCELIKQIPLSIYIFTDSWYWLLDDKGEFTVKSYYRALKGECADDCTRLWKKIWALKLPSKVAYLIWRLCRDCLPTNATLFMRYVNVEITCPWCHCSAKKVGLDKPVSCVEQETPKVVVERAFQQGSREHCLEMAMLC